MQDPSRFLAKGVLVFVDHLQLADFRSYAGVDVELGAGVAIFVGANGQGKTNLVEAVAYLSTLSSHRVAADQPLVRAGSGKSSIALEASRRPGTHLAAFSSVALRLGSPPSSALRCTHLNAANRQGTSLPGH